METPPACRATTIVIGGGASGVLTAVHLASRAERPHEVNVVESRPQVGRGIAFGAVDERHLLNSPTREMSALSDQPDDFTDWVAARGLEATKDSFVPRSIYGEYLGDVFDRARRANPSGSTIEVVKAEATAIVLPTDGADGPLRVGLPNGSHLEADHVVLAIGPPPSAAPWSKFVGLAPSPGLIVNAWDVDALSSIGNGAEVLLVGTGLTMIDAARVLLQQSPATKVYARSRHGLLPLVHSNQAVIPMTPQFASGPRSARELLGAIRVAADKASFAGEDWRAVIAGVRGIVPELWQRLSATEQARLRRHAVRYWEIHRHRMAPQVGAEIEAVVHEGRLQVGVGHLVDLHSAGARYRAVLRSRTAGEEQLLVDAVVNCTGPAAAYGNDSRLVRQLLNAGLARQDAAGTGLLVDPDGDLCDARGRPNRRLHTLGWLRRGQLYESTAIPEIRRQAEALADRMLAISDG